MKVQKQITEGFKPVTVGLIFETIEDAEKWRKAMGQANDFDLPGSRQLCCILDGVLR